MLACMYQINKSSQDKAPSDVQDNNKICFYLQRNKYTTIFKKCFHKFWRDMEKLKW